LFLLSAAVVSLQLFLMRLLSITRYHHFSYLVISTALLGFGVSGTFLTFTSRRLKTSFLTWAPALLFLFTFSAAACYLAAEAIPIDIQYLFYSKKQLLMLTLYNLLLFVPFFFAALFIGLMLIYFKGEVGTVYGVNLFGTGAGGVFAILAMHFVPPQKLTLLVMAAGLISLLLWFASSKKYLSKRYVFIAASFFLPPILLLLYFVRHDPSINIDQYKALSHFQRLERQNDARAVISRYGPRARIDIYESDTIHNTLFAGLTLNVLPPPQMAILLDGDMAGTVFRVHNEEDASVLDFTPQSVIYRLIERPRVLLLGEVGGVNVWLAKRFGAASITVVQGNPQLNQLMLEDLAEAGGDIYRSKGVKVVEMEPRLFLEKTDELFDIIHIVTAEGMSAGVSGFRSLHEDYLLTVESMAKAIKKLSARGAISITRGIQAPPRDNIKIFSLFAAALEFSGVKDVAYHLYQASNYLAVNTILSKRPFTPEIVSRYKEVCNGLLMDIEYPYGTKPDGQDRHNLAQGPEGSGQSYYNYAARMILSPQREDFFKNWVYNVRPPSDGRPYFYDFFKWSSLSLFIKSYGETWLRRLEAGYVVLVFTFLVTALVALALIIMPLYYLKKVGGGSRNRFATAIYFSAIGFGFMFIEMVFIQKLVKFLGDPLYSVSAVITAILVFAGIGSMSQQKMGGSPVFRSRIAAFLIFLLLILYMMFLDQLFYFFIDYSLAVRFASAILCLSPVSFLMGWMFPNALEILGKGSGNMVPWALAINGFASVCAAPLSTALSMSQGFSGVLLVAMFLYLLAGGVCGLLKR